jgi:hypothetical protein
MISALESLGSLGILRLKGRHDRAVDHRLRELLKIELGR